MSNTLVPVRDEASGEVFYLDLQNNTRTMRDQSGKLVTMDLGVGDVHLDSALTSVCFGFKLASGVADEIAPVIPTSKASDKYFTWNKDDVFQQTDGLAVAAGAAIPELSPRVSSTAFSTVPYAVQAFVPAELEANADSPLRPRMAATRRLMNTLMIAREKRVADALRLSTNYGSSYKATVTSGAKWNGGATSNPVQDLYTRIEAALMPINKIVMSEQTFHDFVQNAAVQKYTAMKASTPGASPLAGTDQALAVSALLSLPPIHVGAMKAKGSTTGTYDYIWGGDVVLVHQPDTLPADGQEISSMYTMRWTGAGNGEDGASQGGFFVRSYFDPKRGPRGGTVIVVGHNDAEVFISDVVSGLLISAHQ